MKVIFKIICFVLILLFFNCKNYKVEERKNELKQFIEDLDEKDFCNSLYQYNLHYQNFNKNSFEQFLKENNKDLFHVINTSQFNYKIVDTLTNELGILIDGIDHKFNGFNDVIQPGEIHESSSEVDLLFKFCWQSGFNNNNAFGYYIGEPLNAENIRDLIENIDFYEVLKDYPPLELLYIEYIEE